MDKPITLKVLLAEQNMRLADLVFRLSIGKATASRWSKDRIPAERVPEVETATGIPRWKLRPDLFQEPK